MMNNELPQEEFPCPVCGGEDHDSRSAVLSLVDSVRAIITEGTEKVLTALESENKIEVEIFKLAVFDYLEARRQLGVLIDVIPEFAAIKKEILDRRE